MKTTKKKTKSQKNPPRCENCGQPNPDTSEGYTFCCNELEVYHGDPRYADAKREWNR